MTQKKLLIIHGLNNRIEALAALGRPFQDEYQVSYIKLPQHGPKAFKVKFSEAVSEFKSLLESELNEETYILSYSLGCAYLQYLFEEKILSIDLDRVIYLSPALKTKMNLKYCRYLPRWFPILSLAPKDLRARSFCYWGQYQTLLQLIEKLSLNSYPTIFADPKDEVIKLEGLEFHSIVRDYLSYGEHHLTIHPRYFQKDEWSELIEKIKARLRKET